jgi:prolyl 4-hydroxylase
MSNTLTLARQSLSETPSNAALTDYIMVAYGVLSPEQCRQLIGRFEASEALEKCQREPGHSFVQLDITTAWPDAHAALLPIFTAQLQKYQQITKACFWPPGIRFEHLRMKRYLPNGRDSFPPHVDVTDQASARRFLAAFIYLNAPAAGETVFPHLDLVIPPETGKLLAFPPLWLFPHEGRAPKRDPKYILHTYLCYGS